MLQKLKKTWKHIKRKVGLPFSPLHPLQRYQLLSVSSVPFRKFSVCILYIAHTFSWHNGIMMPFWITYPWKTKLGHLGHLFISIHKDTCFFQWLHHMSLYSFPIIYLTNLLLSNFSLLQSKTAVNLLVLRIFGYLCKDICRICS